MIEAFAPAKINLSLHVTGQRDDGYHLLDSLVVFVDVGDRLFFELSDDLTLSVTGPKADGVPTGSSNLVLRAARLLGANKGAKITLQKNLPAAAGIGGGSSDAAAAIRGLSKLWNTVPPNDCHSLGADIPVCLRARPTRMRGIGEELSDIPNLPDAWLVLANPGVEMATPAVFNRLTDKNQPPMGSIPDFSSTADFANWLLGTRNDLQIPAIELEPVVAEAIDLIAAQDGCLVSRMSGSGATCWGLFGNKLAADEAAAAIQVSRPNWWTVATKINPLS